MILNNYYNICKQLYSQIGYSNPSFGVAFTATNGSSVTTYANGEYYCKDPMCFNLTSTSVIYTALPGTGNKSGNSIGIVFGSNDTPVTPDDYTTDAIPNITVVNITISRVNTSNGKLTVIFKNGNSSPITIKDVIICGGCGASNYSSPHAAIIREVFPQPITVEAGQHFTFSLTKSYGE